jgi:hypothetical protein
MELVGYGMTKRCADKVFAQAGFAPGQGRDEVGVVELHDCFAANEVGGVSRLCLMMTCIERGYFQAHYIPCVGPLRPRRSS